MNDAGGAKLDEYDVRYWFAEAPEACVSNSDALVILHKWEHPIRPWVRYPSQWERNAARTAAEKKDIERQVSEAQTDLFKHQHVSWWNDLRPRLLPARRTRLSIGSLC